MKAIILISVAMVMIIGSMSVLAGDDRITAVKIDELIYQFNCTSANVTEYRWTFGDGAASTSVSPVHEYQEYRNYTVICDMTIANSSVVTKTYELNLEKPLLDTNDATLNFNGVSIPGAFLLVSCSLMFTLARSGNHPLGDVLGSDIVSFLYFLGIVAGGLLVFGSIYGGA